MQVALQITENSNAVIVDPLGFDQSLKRLSRRFTESDFDDVCAFSVEAILRDRIWLLPSSSLEFGRDTTLLPLQREGVLHPLRRQRKGRTLQARNGPKPHSSRFGVLTRESKGNSIPVLPDATQVGAFEKTYLPLHEHAICNLIEQNRQLSSTALKARLTFAPQHRDFIHLRLPPIPYEVLRRSRDVDDIPNAIISVRQDMSAPRRFFGEVSAMLRDKSISPARKSHELHRLQREIASLSSSVDTGFTGMFALSGQYLLRAAIPAIDVAKGFTSGNQWDTGKGLLGLLSSIRDVAQNGVSWHLQPLRRTYKTYMNTSDHELRRELHRLFRIK